MAYTLDDLAQAQAALLNAERRVRDASGREVELRSVDEIRAIIADIKADIAVQGGYGVPRTTYAGFTRD